MIFSLNPERIIEIRTEEEKDYFLFSGKSSHSVDLSKMSPKDFLSAVQASLKTKKSIVLIGDHPLSDFENVHFKINKGSIEINKSQRKQLEKIAKELESCELSTIAKALVRELIKWPEFPLG